jgi:hypothetical protein
MSVIDGLRLWQWGAHTFARVVQNGDVQPWFKPQALVSVEPILGANTRYVDVGGITYEALQLRAVFANVAARDAVLAAVGTVAPLTNIGGATVSAVLVSAVPINLGPGYYAADLTLERL